MIVLDISVGKRDSMVMRRAARELKGQGLSIDLVSVESEDLDNKERSFLEILKVARKADLVLIRCHGGPSRFKKFERLRGCWRRPDVPSSSIWRGLGRPWRSSVTFSLCRRTSINRPGGTSNRAERTICAGSWQGDAGSRVIGLEVIPLSDLGRPRIDVTLRISGLFRDTFPNLIEMIDEGVETIASLDETDDENYLVMHLKEDIQKVV
jgi:hypothetical protein